MRKFSGWAAVCAKIFTPIDVLSLLAIPSHRTSHYWSSNGTAQWRPRPHRLATCASAGACTHLNQTLESILTTPRRPSIRPSSGSPRAGSVPGSGLEVRTHGRVLRWEHARLDTRLHHFLEKNPPEVSVSQEPDAAMSRRPRGRGTSAHFRNHCQVYVLVPARGTGIEGGGRARGKSRVYPGSRSGPFFFRDGFVVEMKRLVATDELSLLQDNCTSRWMRRHGANGTHSELYQLVVYRFVPNERGRGQHGIHEQQTAFEACGACEITETQLQDCVRAALDICTAGRQQRGGTMSVFVRRSSPPTFWGFFERGGRVLNSAGNVVSQAVGYSWNKHIRFADP